MTASDRRTDLRILADTRYCIFCGIGGIYDTSIGIGTTLLVDGLAACRLRVAHIDGWMDGWMDG